MKLQTVETLQFLCRSLSNASGMPVRIFRGGVCVAYHSVFQLSPDPVLLQLPVLLDDDRQAGVVASPLMQYYGFSPFPGEIG